MSNLDQDRHLNIASTARATVSTTSIVGIRLVCQALVLVLSARLLGADGFGFVAAIVAISMVLGPWSGFGYDFLALRAISDSPVDSGSHFRSGVWIIAITAVPVVVVAATAASFWPGHRDTAGLTVLVFASELLFLRVSELIAKIFQGNELFREMAVTRLSISVSRLLVLGSVAVLTSDITPLQWGWAYLFAALLSLAFSFAYLRAGVSLAPRDPEWRTPRLHDGLHFAAGITSVRLRTELDKALVLVMAGAAGAGIYGAAQRIVSLTVAPVISLVNVVITSMFRLNRRADYAQLRRRSLVVCVVAAAYGTVVGAFVWFLLPDVAALFLGEEFRALVVGLLPLSLLVVPTSCRLVGEQAIAALGKFRIRLIVQWVIAALSVLLYMIVIPAFGWLGAAWVLVASEAALALCFILIIVGPTPAMQGKAQ